MFAPHWELIIISLSGMTWRNRTNWDRLNPEELCLQDASRNLTAKLPEKLCASTPRANAALNAKDAHSHTKLIDLKKSILKCQNFYQYCSFAGMFLFRRENVLLPHIYFLPDKTKVVHFKILLKGSFDAFLKIIILCIWCNRICWHNYFSYTVHFCRSSMPRLSRILCFLQSPSFAFEQSIANT